MRRRSERGAALIWAVATMTAVLLGISLVAGALAGQAGALRRLKTEAARADLERAGRAWGAERLRRGAIEQPETLALAGGTIVLRPASGGGAELVVQVAGEAPGEPRPLARGTQ